MREFIYYSKSAPTSGSYVKEDLMKSGRLDIAIHTIIAAFFLSHKMRDDVTLHLIFDGPPNPPRHLEIKPVLEGKTGEDKIYLNKKNIAAIIKKMLYKYKEDEKHEVFPGYFIEKKSLFSLITDLAKEGKALFILDKKGESLRSAGLPENSVFIIGDHEGLPLNDKRALKRLKDSLKHVSVGSKTYFASQTLAVLNNELDFREEL
jgi:tRNA pseudouridine-54 N-methylase